MLESRISPISVTEKLVNVQNHERWILNAGLGFRVRQHIDNTPEDYLSKRIRIGCSNCFLQARKWPLVSIMFVQQPYVKENQGTCTQGLAHSYSQSILLNPNLWSGLWPSAIGIASCLLSIPLLYFSLRRFSDTDAKMFPIAVGLMLIVCAFAGFMVVTDECVKPKGE